MSSLITRFKNLVESAKKNGLSSFEHTISRSTFGKYKVEVREVLESAGMSFYEDKSFFNKMFKEYHEKMVCQGVLKLNIWN